MVNIEDYFKRDSEMQRELTLQEWERRQDIRKELDSFQLESDMYYWIHLRRSKKKNLEEDWLLFEIPMNEITIRDRGDAKNPYYNGEGPKETAHFIRFKGSLKIAGIVSLIAVSVLLLVYVSGVIGSLGSTPFIICGEEDIKNKSVPILTLEQAQQAANKEYAGKAFIAEAKARHWKDDAIVGTLAYILREGSGMGTFTYESYWFMNGPSGVPQDKTLSNEAWLNWLETDGRIQSKATSSYSDKSFTAIGLGLIQSTDRWEDGGEKTVTNATNLIQWCDEKGKPWQDPQTQMQYLFDTQFEKDYAFDTYGMDPTKDDRSPEEWCARVSAGIGMPAYHWTDVNSYMNDHLAMVDAAVALFKEYKGASDILHFDQNGQNPCEGNKGIYSGGNATIADAAVTLAGGTEMISVSSIADGNQRIGDISSLSKYKEVMDEWFAGSGETNYTACDGGSATPVLWSGADKEFCKRSTGAQYQYMTNSDKWQDVGDYGSVDLQPGDVLITREPGHIKIYVGNEAVQKRFPESNADMYASSNGEYFPYLYKDDPSYDNRAFAVFRNIKPDEVKS